MEIENLFDLSHTIAKDLFSGKKYPWDVLPCLKDFILCLGKTLNENYEYMEDDIWIAKTAKVAEGVCLKGPLIIDNGAEIRYNAYIRGSVIIGNGAVVGNSTEIKNSLLFDGVQVPHYNYIGDSVLGYKAHFGAGAITSNVKSDKTLVTVKGDGINIPTALKKFGAMVGDNAEIGCHAVLCPGTVIGKNTTVYPLSLVRGIIKDNSIYKDSLKIVKKEL